jgi:threonylcarbamoyladenosine tRNA methylthiotransferase MtaB
VASYYVQNFGCRATQADGAAIERQFEERGLERASGLDQAEVVVLNTCTVTASADQDARAAIRRVHRENPQARIVVTGCYAQRSPEELASLPGVTQVIGNSHKHQLAELVEEFAGERCETSADFVPLSNLVSPDDLSQRPTTEDRRPAVSQRPSTKDQGPTVDGQLRTENRELRTGVFVSDIFAHTDFLAAPVFDAANERTRPNLKIQDGCDNRCSFCVIPYVRGQSRSMRLEQILDEVNHLVSAGYRELVISGINLGRWGRDLESGVRLPVFGFRENLQTCGARHDETIVNISQPSDTITLSRRHGRTPKTEDRKPNFASLIRAILGSTVLEKLRISSVEPMDWTDELITLVASSPRIAKHAHVPMQSGSDAVLRRMHRKYRPWHYREKIEKIRATMPDAAIGADVMAGFPGETDAEFEATRRMIEDLPFTYLHVFTYSPRPGTPAADMPRQVPVRIARERNRVLRDLAAEKKQAFMLNFIGRTVEAITLARGFDNHVGGFTDGATGVPPVQPDRNLRLSIEEHESTGTNQPCDAATFKREPQRFTEALTDNYLPLLLRGSFDSNQWLLVRVEGLRDGKLVGGPVA